MDINMDYPPTNLNYIHHLPEFNWLELREQSFTASDWDIVELYIGHETSPPQTEEEMMKWMNEPQAIVGLVRNHCNPTLIGSNKKDKKGHGVLDTAVSTNPISRLCLSCDGCVGALTWETSPPQTEEAMMKWMNELQALVGLVRNQFSHVLCCCNLTLIGSNKKAKNGHEVLDAAVSTNPNSRLCLSCDGCVGDLTWETSPPQTKEAMMKWMNELQAIVGLVRNQFSHVLFWCFVSTDMLSSW
ncbi:hypothetical protein F2Q69_00054144 [Brassica cretica]|uniref:Uncharacterized protein n=1 Tax=Brassica cretica TaxID=69181 RepID=A0A8S9MTJ3_BRACR|nr:hypothetical protein F2Q69_00054144 [Brassica cretica]